MRGLFLTEVLTDKREDDKVKSIVESFPVMRQRRGTKSKGVISEKSVDSVRREERMEPLLS
jgi:hypothetical protein